MSPSEPIRPRSRCPSPDGPLAGIGPILWGLRPIRRVPGQSGRARKPPRDPMKINGNTIKPGMALQLRSRPGPWDMSMNPGLGYRCDGFRPVRSGGD